MTRRRHTSKKARMRHAGPTRGRHVAIEGTLRRFAHGSAVVSTPEGQFSVARGGLGGGMDRDVVRVELLRRPGHETLAYVRTVVQRATTRFVGTYGIAGPLGVAVPLDERIAHDFFILPDDESPVRLGVSEGDVIVVRILSYPARHEEGIATIERKIGAPEGVDIPIERVLASHGITEDFPDAVTQQTKQELPTPAEIAAHQPEREHARERLCATIDPVDAKDFDDAISCERTDEGGYLLGVHIADVTQYAPWSSPLDIEARGRTCSTYLVDRVVPMLPERLSNDVCSLRPGVDRLVMSVYMTFSPAGKLLKHHACASLIRSSARLDYDTVDKLLTGDVVADELPVVSGVSHERVAQMLRDAHQLADLRERVRSKRGAIDFDGVEAKVVLAPDGTPTGVSVRRSTPATSLVEEAMLAANETVAQMLSDHPELPCAFRVHEQPSADALAATLPILSELGVLEPGDAERLHAGDPFAIQDVVARAKGTAAETCTTTLLLHAMKRAVYLPTNDGHYALGARAYCHFTSPIRRYPDVLVHRALKSLIGVPVPVWTESGTPATSQTQTPVTSQTPAPSGAQTTASFSHIGVPHATRMAPRDWREVRAVMPQLCRTCSDQEREADAAAHESQKIKMAELYVSHIGETCVGTITGCERFGLFVRLDETYAEGLLPVRALGEEWFTYDEGTLSLTGEESGTRYRLGQRIAVTVSACDPAKGRIDFTRASTS